MAAERFYLPFRPTFDMNGVALPDAKLYFYYTGGLTPAPAYSDSGLTTLLPTPVVADAAGRWPAIYLNDAITYRVVVKDADGVTIPGHDDDPYIAGIVEDLTDEMQALYDSTADARDDAVAASNELTNLAALAITSGADGYFYSEYGTRYTYSVVDGRVTPCIAPHIYIDPFNGSDSNDGLTVDTAIQTSTGLAAHSLLGAVGTMGTPTIVTDLTIGIIGHATSKIRDSFDYYLQSAANGYRQMHRCSFVKVGDLPVRFDCTDIVTSGSFTPHGSISNAYVFSKSHTMDTGSSNRFRGWVNGKSLKRVELEASLVAGTYWYSGDPTSGAAKSIAFIDHDSSDPRSSGRVVEFTTRQCAISTRGGFFQGIWGERNGTNDGIIHSKNGFVTGTSGPIGTPTKMVDCLLYEGTKHHAVLSQGVVIGVSCVNSMDDEYDPQGGAAYLAFYDGDINGKQGLLQNVHFIADTSLFPGHSVGQTSTWVSPFLAHDTTADGVDLARLDVIDCSLINMAQPISGGSADVMVVRGLYANGTTSASGGTLVIDGTGQIEVYRSMLANSNRWVSANNIKMRSCLVLGNVTGGGSQITTLSQPGSIDIENCMILTSPQQTSALVDLNDAGSFRFRRNIAGPGYILGVASYEPAATITVNNDYNVVQVHNPSNYYVTYKNANYELAAWQALDPTFDPNTVIATMASQFTSTAIPTITNLDIRLATGSDAETVMTDPLTQAELEAMLDRPDTYAKAQAYYNEAPNSSPVLLV